MGLLSTAQECIMDQHFLGINSLDHHFVFSISAAEDCSLQHFYTVLKTEVYSIYDFEDFNIFYRICRITE